MIRVVRAKNDWCDLLVQWHEMNGKFNWYLFDKFELVFESSLIGLFDRFSHFSMADNSQWIFDRIDEIPESSFSFKCRPKRIFISGYFRESLFMTFSLFCKYNMIYDFFCCCCKTMVEVILIFCPLITLQISHFLSFIIFLKLTFALNWLQSHLLIVRLPMLELHV